MTRARRVAEALALLLAWTRLVLVLPYLLVRAQLDVWKYPKEPRR